MKFCKIFLGIISVAFLAGLLGCAGAQWQTKTTIGSKTTINGDGKTMHQLAQQQGVEAKHLMMMQNAEPRKATDPILVALYRPTIADKLAPAFDSQKFFDILVEEFSRDAVIRLVDQNIVDRAQARANANKYSGVGSMRPRVTADVSVYPHVMAEQVAGINRKTGKTGSMTALVLQAEIVSHYLPADRFELKETGNIFRNQEVTQKFSQKAVETIKTRPHIPGHAYHQEVRKESGKQVLSIFDTYFRKE
jgi:hypothetical protein